MQKYLSTHYGLIFLGDGDTQEKMYCPCILPFSSKEITLESPDR